MAEQPSSEQEIINRVYKGPSKTGDNVDGFVQLNYVWNSVSSKWERMTQPTGGTGGSSVWGDITGTLSDQADLQTALNTKYDASNPNSYTGDQTLSISGTSLTISGAGGNTVTIPSGGGTTLPADAAGWLHDNGTGTLAWTIPVKADVGLGNVDNTSDATKNSAAVALTNKDLTSGTNTFPTFNQNTTGSAATLTTARTIGILTGDVTTAGSTFNGSANNTNATVVGKINGVALSGLATGILKNTTTTGVPSIAVAADFPTLNQNTTGSAATLTTPRTIGGVSFNGSANISLTSGSGIQKGDGSGGLTAATAGTDYAKPAVTSTTSAPGATPTTVTGTAPLTYIDFTGLNAAITSMTTNLSGSPSRGDRLWYSFTDDGTARGLTWGTSFEASTVALPTTTVISTRLDVGLVWNVVTSKWRCMAVA